MIAKITRTVFRRKAIFTWYNETIKALTDTESYIYEDIDESELLNRMTKNGENVNDLGKLVSINISTNAEELLATMPLEAFCKNATLKPVSKKEN